MSFNNYPDLLKPLIPYLQRANEFEKRSPIVSFYCRTYAAQMGISIVQSHDQADDLSTQILTDLMDRLEQDKEQLNIDNQQEEGKSVVELFALKVFKKADDADRVGRHDTQIAKLYYAASILIEVTKQFGDLSEEMLEKQKYAKWRAAEIQKSIRTGQPVTPIASNDDSVMNENEEEDQQMNTNPFQSSNYNFQQQQSFNTMSNEEEENEDDHINRLLRDEQQKLNTSFTTNSDAWLNLSQQQQNWNTFNNPTTIPQQPPLNNLNMPPSPFNNPPSFNNVTTSNFNNTNNNNIVKQSSSPSSTGFVNNINNNTLQPTSTGSNSSTPTMKSNSVQNTKPVLQNRISSFENVSMVYSPSSNTSPTTTTTNTNSSNKSIGNNNPPPTSTSTTVINTSNNNITTKPTTTSATVTAPPSKKKDVSIDEMVKAQKFCKYAMSSLQFEDVETAKKYLRDALNLLGE
ncbi:hypothetical protein ABK040_001013 [Willaertia magna]